jgi:hypothetical protein
MIIPDLIAMSHDLPLMAAAGKLPQNTCDAWVKTVEEAVRSLESATKMVCFSKDEAAGMAIRVEDVMNIMNVMLQGAKAQTNPQDHKRQTVIFMARDRNQHLDWVAKRLKGEA